MGNQKSITQDSPLSSILLNWKKFDPLTLKKRRLIFFCNTVWPQCKLEDGESWPKNKSLNYDTILQLDNFYHRLKKWTKMPYVQVFMALRDNSDSCHFCKIDPSVQRLTLTLDPSVKDVNIIIGQTHSKREKELQRLPSTLKVVSYDSL